MKSLVLNEFLVALGLQDNMTKKLEKVIKDNEQKTEKFAVKFAKDFVKAGTAVAAFTATVAAGLVAFTNKLAKADDELNTFARNLGLPKEEAYKVKSALDTMGKSMEEIALDPNLLKQFESLKKNAETLKMPDLTEALKPFREMATAFKEIKQTATNVLQWVGYYFLKYVQQPMENIKKMFNGFNETIKKNIPNWASNIAKALAWVVQLGGTLIRGAGIAFSAIKRLFDMIPDKVKIVTAVLSALFAFIKMSPIHRIITLISIALLLLDDFFTFLDGGDSLLGPVWKTLTDFFGGFMDSGKDALSFFTGEFLPKIVDKIRKLFPELVKTGVKIIKSLLTGILSMLPSIVAVALDLVLGLVDAVLNALPELINAGMKIVMSLIDGIIEMLPILIETAVNLITTILEKIIEYLPKIIEAGINVVMSLVNGIVRALPSLVEKIVGLVPMMVSLVTENLSRIVELGIKTIMSFINGIVEAIPKLVGQITELIPTIIQTLMDALPLIIDAGIGILMALIDGITQSIPQLAKAAISIITSIVSTIVESLHLIIEAGIKILISLIEGILQIVPQLIDAAINLVMSITQAIIDNLPLIIDAGISILTALIDGVIGMLPQLVDMAIGLITSILNTIIENLPIVIQAGIDILIALIDGIITMLPQLIDASIGLIQAILNALIENLPIIIQAGIDILTALIEGIAQMLPQLIDAAISLVMSLIEGIVSMLPQLIDTAFGLVMSIITAIIDNLPEIIEAGIKIITSLIEGLVEAIPQIVAMLPTIITAIVEGLANIGDMLLEAGVDIVSGIWNGILSSGGWLANQVSEFFSGIFSGIGTFVSEMFEGLPDSIIGGFKAVVNGLVNGINAVIALPFNGINAALEGIKSVNIFGLKPFDWIPTIDIPQIPQLAEGGVLPKGKRGLLEGDGAEAVVPLEKNTEWIKKVAEQFKNEFSQKDSAQQSSNSEALKNMTDKLNAVLNKLTSAIDTLTSFVEKIMSKFSLRSDKTDEGKKPPDPKCDGNNFISAIGGAVSKLFPSKDKNDEVATAPAALPNSFAENFAEFSAKMNEFLDNTNKVMAQMGQSANASYSTTNSKITYDNRTYDQKSTFNINDMSGEPRVVADMIDRNQSLRIRNTRGLFA